MWTRSELKGNAKLVLKRTYWLAFAVCLAGVILMGVSRSYSTMNTLQLNFDFTFSYTAILTVGIFSLIYGIFISNILNVGMNNFFMTSREYDASFGKLFSAFSGNYRNVVTTMFLQGLYIFLWTLLLIVPGIIKSYEYIFVPYILAENPGLSHERVFQISKSMTYGQKFNIFVLQLSFLGWELLGLLACGIGIYFVTPYVQATFAELYAAQRSEALLNGTATEQELCGFYNDEF